MSGGPRRDDERELQELLRLAAGVVFSLSFLLIVVVVLISEVFQDRDLDTALLLGLGTSSLTAATAMFGVQVVLGRRRD